MAKRIGKSKTGKSKSAKLKLPTREFLRKFGIPSFLIPGIILAAVLGFNWEKLAGQDPRTNPDIFGNILAAAEIVDGDTPLSPAPPKRKLTAPAAKSTSTWKWSGPDWPG